MSGERGRRLVEMKVAHLALDPVSRVPIVILEDPTGDTLVPIWIGLGEAAAIASELEHVQLDRPMTHDLMRAMLDRCGAKMVRAEIHRLQGQTFHAAVVLANPSCRVDARPSDAIALALRMAAPICVAQRVIDRARDCTPHVDRGASTAAAVAGIELLETLRDEDFGKWKM